MNRAKYIKIKLVLDTFKHKHKLKDFKRFFKFKYNTLFKSIRSINSSVYLVSRCNMIHKLLNKIQTLDDQNREDMQCPIELTSNSTSLIKYCVIEDIETYRMNCECKDRRRI